MAEVEVTLREGEVRTISARDGFSLMEAIRFADIDELLAMCGGCLGCATCHVIVDPQWFTKLPPPGRDEDELLASSDTRTATSRLSCQIRMSDAFDGLRVTIAPE